MDIQGEKGFINPAAHDAGYLLLQSRDTLKGLRDLALKHVRNLPPDQAEAEWMWLYGADFLLQDLDKFLQVRRRKEQR